MTEGALQRIGREVGQTSPIESDGLHLVVVGSGCAVTTHAGEVGSGAFPVGIVRPVGRIFLQIFKILDIALFG